ncbi:cysteine-rich receptor-like protein kinase 6 [Hordeum vulgare subsp. vulgare]|uniref:Cysteine-rich receptor-like protein kinase 10 n=2 Tax=Hordeum vulgare subsp. vulgare TaxID=112509 RepID=A0A8I6Y5E9_HORVV|nr:cysteine-rich receptor-like protein kinase 6 [Hordeum vulgare subsp. vulgare]
MHSKSYNKLKPSHQPFRIHGMARRLLLSVAIAAATLLTPPGAAGYPWPLCGQAGGFPADSNYKASLSLLAATMPKNTSMSPGLFATAQAGAAPEKVWALALCRGDASASYCFSCIDQAFQDLISSCDYKDATIYFDSCVLTYSNIHFRAADDAKYSPTYSIRNLANATADSAGFQRLVAALVNATAGSAAFNSSARLYASGQADFDKELPHVYSWAQCTPDMSPDRCWRCLVRLMRELPTYFTDGIGARVLGIRCSLRYETQPFFNGTATVRLSATSARAPAPAALPNVGAVGKGIKFRVPIMVPIILLPILSAISLIACFFLWRKLRPPTEAEQPYPSYSAEVEDVESVDSIMIDILTLQTATDDFAESNKLGEGGFGAVYKGTLPDGEQIAVKRMSKSSTQGLEELRNELALVAKLKHKNLVSLIGVCLEQQERLLVYEFLPNRSLDLILFAKDSAKREQLDWAKRHKIIEGIARGLQYLHEDSQLKVVHRDLKASNILLDMNSVPKISDFGLAKIFGRDQTQGVTNRVVGTHGYMAPEYMMRGNYSVKSDAFSFGVMVLEIVTGRKNNDDSSGKSEDLLTTVWEHSTTSTVLEVVDPCMNGSFLEKEVLRCVQIGLLCVQENPVDRPTMSTVVTMLGGETFTLPAPSKPPFCSRKNGTCAD